VVNLNFVDLYLYDIRKKKMLKEDLEQGLRETLLKIEDTKYLLEDGKTIQAYNKLLGVRQKLGLIFSSIRNGKNHTEKAT